MIPFFLHLIVVRRDYRAEQIQRLYQLQLCDHRAHISPASNVANYCNYFAAMTAILALDRGPGDGLCSQAKIRLQFGHELVVAWCPLGAVY